jgi:hypothetical protein
MGLAVLAALLVGLYFVDYTNSPGTAGGQPVSEVSLKTSLETSIQVLSISLGPAARPYWRVAGSAVLTLWLLSIAVLVVALLKKPQERLRALGLLSFISAAGSLVLIIGLARAGLGEEYIFSGHYQNMVLPALCCAYFIWIVYGTSTLKSIIQVSLFAAACLFFLPNLYYGLGVARHFGNIGKALDQDIRAGVPPFMLAERQIAFLNPATDDAKGIALALRQMRQAGMPQFRHMTPDPAFRAVALPVTPIGVNQMIWHNGVGYSSTGNPGQASVDFAFTEPRFVYAIRLEVSYGPQTSGWAAFRISWRNSNRGTWRGEKISGCKGGDSLRVETIPHDLWARRYRAGSRKSLTIWINSTIDGFRICPDTKPFSFSLSEITLLVP